MTRERTKKLGWTTKKILVGKTVPFIVIALLLYAYTQPWVYNHLEIFLTWIDENVVTIPITRGSAIFFIGLSFVLPVVVAVIGSLLILKIYLTVKLKIKYGTTKVEPPANETRFKWSFIYSILISYILFFGILLIGFGLVGVSGIAEDHPGIGLLIILAFIAGAIAAAVMVPKRLSKKMVSLTGTNKELIDAFERGEFDKDIPAKFCNPKDLEGIIQFLLTGRAYSVKSAVLLYRISSITQKVAAGGTIIGVLVILLTFGAVNSAMDEQFAQLEYNRDINNMAEKIAARIKPEQIRKALRR